MAQVMGFVQFPTFGFTKTISLPLSLPWFTYIIHFLSKSILKFEAFPWADQLIYLKYLITSRQLLESFLS